MRTEIKGSTMPVLEVTLESGERVVSTHGELAWMTPGLHMAQTMNTGGKHGFMAGLARMAGGGGLFLTTYEATNDTAMVTFATKMPGSIFPVTIAPGAGFLVHRRGWLCATSGVTPTVGLQNTFRGGLWGDEGFILERLEGQGTAWVELAGETTTYDLHAGQTILAHPGHVGVFQDSVQFTITRVPGIANKLFGGDGFHLVALTGPGRVWLQSMPLPVLAGALAPYLPTAPSVQEAPGLNLGNLFS